MVTTKPQWATPERQDHLVRLFAQHQNQCRLGHIACPDLRHHYERCAVEHDSERACLLKERIRVLESEEQQLSLSNRNRLITIETTSRKARKRTFRSVGVIQPLLDALDVELTGLRENCQVTEHYFEHLERAMFGDAPLENPLTYYRKVSEGAIESWKEYDREERSQLRKLEQQHIHDGTYGRFGSDFDPVARDVYHQQQPTYYMLGFGIGSESKKRIAIIRIPSTYIRLDVEVANAFQGVKVSKNKKRKMARYQSGPPAEVSGRIDALCSQAVQEFWDSRSVKQ